MTSTPSPSRATPRRAASALALALALTALVARAQDDVAPPQRPYTLDVDVSVLPTEKSAHVTLRIGEGAINVRRLTFRVDPDRHHLFEGDGRISRDAPDQLTWDPPADGGALRYVFRIDHLRDANEYDARCASSWALFRGDDLVPPARSRTREGAFSVTRLHLRLPDRWEAVLPFPKDESGAYVVENPDRELDRPTGWFLVGKLHTARDTVAGVEVVIASPKGSGVRRQDQMALLRWTLPELKKLIALPPRLTIVGASDPMWRGGLSGPGSIYLHGDRPLIERDFTSPLLHEIIHTVMAARAELDGDWVVEGMAELYATELLVRSGTISPEKRQLSIERLTKKSKGASDLAVRSADAAVTARAVLVLRDLDAEIRRRTKDEKSIDDVFRALVADREPISTASFLAVLERVTGESYATFLRRRGVLPARTVPVGTEKPPR